MEHKYRIGVGNFESGVKLENTTEEIRITTNTWTMERTAQMESTSRDVYVENDALSLIETKKRKRHAAEFAFREEEMMVGDQPEEERKLRVSQISLRNQTTKERERDAVLLVSHQNSLRNRSTKAIFLERQIAAETAIRVEEMIVGDQPEEERPPRCSQSSLRNQATKERGRDAVVLVSHQNSLRVQSTKAISLERQIPAETAIRVEKMMAGDQPEEERTPRCSQVSLRNQATKERERDAVVLFSHQNTLVNQSTKVISLERQMAATLDANQELKAERDELMRDNAQLQLMANATARLQSDLDNALSELHAAQSRCANFQTSEIFFKKSCRELEVMKNAGERALWEEWGRAEYHLENERILCILFERKDLEFMEMVRSMQADKQKLLAELDAQKQKADAQIESLTSDKTSLQNELDAARIAKQKGEMVRSMQAGKQKLLAELGEQKQKADAQIQSLTSDNTSMQNELDAARIAIQTGKSEYDNKLAIALLEKENVEKKLALVEGERDARSVALVQKEAQVTKLDAELAIALTTRGNLEKKLEHVDLEIGAARLEVDRQKALVIQQHNEKLKVRNTLVRVQNTLIAEKQKLASDVFLIGKQAAEHKKELDEARTEILHLKMDLEYLREETNRWENMEHDVRSVEQEAAEDERQLLEAHSNIVHLQKTLGKENNRLEKIENDIRLMQEEAAEYETALKQAHVDMFHLNEKLESDINLMREEAAEDKRKLVQAHKNELDQARRNVIHLHEKLESDVNLMREEAAEEKRKLVQAHKNELDQTKRVVIHHEMELESLREEKNRLENDVSLIRVEAAQDKIKLVEVHKNELDEARTNIVDLKMELESSREEKKRLENDLRVTREKAAEVTRKMLQSNNTKLAEVRTEKAQLKKELESLRKEKKRLENDLRVTREKEAEENRKMLQSHKIELDEARTDTVDLRKELESAWEERNRLEKQEYDVSRIQEEAAKDKTKLAQTLKELDETRMDIVGLGREIESLREAKKRLEQLEVDISRIQEETAEDKRKLVQEHNNELDEARTDIVNLKLEVESLREEKNQLDSSQKTIMRNLEEEKDRSLCQICMDSPKDTISFPCLHLQYCFSCLEKHRKRSNTCPSCRTTINGVTCLSVLS